MACLLDITVPATWAPCVGQQRPLLAVIVEALRELREERGPCHVSVPTDMWPLLQTSESLLHAFFIQGTLRAPRTDPTKYHAKALLELWGFFFPCFSQIGFFSLHQPGFLQLTDRMGCAWRTSAASLKSSCPHYSLTTVSILRLPHRLRPSVPKTSCYTVRCCAGWTGSEVGRVKGTQELTARLRPTWAHPQLCLAFWPSRRFENTIRTERLNTNVNGYH